MNNTAAHKHWVGMSLGVLRTQYFWILLPAQAAAGKSISNTPSCGWLGQQQDPEATGSNGLLQIPSNSVRSTHKLIPKAACCYNVMLWPSL